MASLGDLWRGLTKGGDKVVPANEAIPRMRDSSGVLKAVKPSGRKPVVGNAGQEGSEPTPSTAMPVSQRDDASSVATAIVPAAAAPAPILPPSWGDVFPGHYKALLADLQKRGEDPARWEVQDGRDLGVSEVGHSVAFRLHKTNTSVTIQVELTLFKGKLANVRVR